MADSAAAQTNPEEKKAQTIPITEPGTGPRKIPKTIFIDDIEAWVDKYGDDQLFAAMNEMYQKYKYMETSILR